MTQPTAPTSSQPAGPTRDVTFCECFARDGLQHEERFIDTATVTPDPETQALVDSLQKGLDDTLNVAIGTTTTPLDSRRTVVRAEESPRGNLIADAMRLQSGADVALMNGGGIRAGREYSEAFTYGDLEAELPFANEVVVVAISVIGLRRISSRNDLMPMRTR